MNDEQEYCNLRLPCGICRLTMSNCPKVNIVYSLYPSWISTSCEVNIHTNNEKTKEKEHGN